MEKKKYSLKINRWFGAATAFVVIAAIVIVASCGRGSGYRADGGLPPCEITAPLDSIFNPIFYDDDAPGAIVTVMRDDTVRYIHSYGLARLDTAERVTDSTLFNVASVSKLFSAVALLKLCEEGRIILDDSLSKYFPEFAGAFFNDINIRHILTHSSGLPELRPVGKAAWERYSDNHATVFGAGRDYSLYGTEKEHMQIFQRLDTISFKPGTHYQRNGPAFILVAPLVERVTGDKFEKWMERNVFEPAGLKETFFYEAGKYRPRLAHGYTPATPAITRHGSFVSKDGRWAEYDYGEADYFLTMADRGVYSSARDVMKFANALYSGKLISDASLKLLRTPYIQTDIENACFGLGLALRQDDGQPQKCYHVNANGGFAVVSGAWPDRKVLYSIISNRNDWDQRAVMAAVDSILIAKGWLK